MTPKFLSAFVIVANHLVMTASIAATNLWDQEPALWDQAQQYQLVRPLSPVFGVEGPSGATGQSAPVAPPRTNYVGPSGNGVNISNGKLKISLWGTPDKLTLSVAKTDLYNRAALNEHRGHKPAGQLLLMADDFSGIAQPQVATHLHNGLNTLRLQNGAKTADLQFLATRSDSDIMAIQGNFRNLIQPVSVRIARHHDIYNELPAPESGNDGMFFWIHQTFKPDVTFPAGFDYYFVGKVVGANTSMSNADGQAGLGASATKYRPDSTAGSAATAQFAAGASLDVTIYATVVTKAESADPLAEAKNRLNTAQSQGFSKLVSENQAWFHDLYACREQGRIFTGNFTEIKDMLLPYFYQSWANRHTYMSSPDPTRFESDAVYNTIESDSQIWNGIPCFNEELYEGDFVAGRNETIAPYYVTLYNYWMPAFKQIAANRGKAGWCEQTGYVPPTIPKTSGVGWSGLNDYQYCSQVWGYKNVWDDYDYSGKDIVYLRNSVYPGLRDMAEFFRASLTPLGSDGYYHIEPSQVREEEIGRDALDCIAAVKWAFKTAIQASQMLDVDAGMRAVWQDRLDKMAPYYVLPDGRWASVVKNNEPQLAQLTVAHYFVNVTDEFNLESSETNKQRCIKTNRSSYDQPMNRQVEYLLGESPDTLCGRQDNWFWMFAYPGWMMFYAQKLDQGNFNSILPLTTHVQKTVTCWLEPERLCNSRSGTIFFFPCVPGNFDVGFKDFQARGGFLVTGERQGGIVDYALIKARRNVSCTVMNPWPGSTLYVTQQPENAPVLTTHTGEKYAFVAQEGKSYLLGTVGTTPPLPTPAPTTPR